MVQSTLNNIHKKPWYLFTLHYFILAMRRICRKTAFHFSLSGVSSFCNGNVSCEFGPAFNTFFGVDPCGGTYKYLDVTHTCKSRSKYMFRSNQ